MPDFDEVCGICQCDLHFWKWSVPTCNGDLVSNDLQDQPWLPTGNSPVCEACFNLHAAGKIPTFDHLYTDREDLMLEWLANQLLERWATPACKSAHLGYCMECLGGPGTCTY